MVAILASYGFARWDFLGKEALYLLFVGSWLVPFQVTMIPNYLLVSQMGLLNTITSVVLPQLCSAFAVMMLRQHLEAFPKDLLDASQMDGRTSWRTLWEVVVPNLRPALAALAIMLRVDHDWGQPVDVERVLAAHPHPKVIAAVHAETSTGVLSDIAALGQNKGDALLLVDAVTSIGGLELLADDWGIDVGYVGTQKCLGVPPGLSPFTVSDRAFERRVQDPRSWYLDIGLLGGYAGYASGNGRTYHHTAPVSMIAGLEAGLERILNEGLDAVRTRHIAAGAALRSGLQEMGLELFAAEGHRLPSLTTVKVPEGIDSAAVRTYLLRNFSIEIGAGVGTYAKSVWRIGMMGPNANPASVVLVLAALKEAIKES